jgi:hypothetical protein
MFSAFQVERIKQRKWKGIAWLRLGGYGEGKPFVA